MIKIEINAETGSEARGALLELLGLTGQSQVITTSRSNVVVEETEIQLPPATEELPNPAEQPKTKRRTKAEIEAEKNAIESGQQKVQEMVETQQAAEAKAPEETTDATTVTVDDLKKKAVELGRVGKRELCRAVLQKYDAESISTPDKTPLKPEYYAAVLDEFNNL